METQENLCLELSSLQCYTKIKGGVAMDAFNAYAAYLKKQHYDSSLEEHLTMYDHLPYVRDYDMCNGAIMVSGNIIKFFRCTEIKPFTVSNRDNEFEQIVEKHLSEAAKSIPAYATAKDEITFMDDDENANDM